MFSLLYGFYTYATTKVEIRSLLVGIERSGKTTLLEQIKALHGTPSQTLSSITSTIGMNLGKISSQSVDAVFWDLGGSMRGIWEQYYSSADAIIFVVDASDKSRFGEAASTLELVLLRIEELGTSVPVFIFANKADKSGAARLGEVIDAVCRPAGLFPSEQDNSGINATSNSSSSLSNKSDHCSIQLQQSFSLLPGQRQTRPPATPILKRECKLLQVSAVTLEGLSEAVNCAVASAKIFSLTRL
jgi:ADP-ribosylation factor related protein 1